MRRSLGPLLLVLMMTAAVALGLLSRPASGAAAAHADYVVVVGSAGLRWDDINPTDTPTLWQAASSGAIGALSVRSASAPTCPADGWLTLGAGNYATTGGQLTATKQCPNAKVSIRSPDGIGAQVLEAPAWGEKNQDLPWGAVPGALAESVRCSTAVGPGAAIAAVRPSAHLDPKVGGRVDRYAATLPADPKSAQATLSQCVLSIVDLGTVAGADPAKRKAAAKAVDKAFGAVLAARPEKSLILVAGLSDTDTTSRLHVAIADGPGFSKGWLSSPSTGRSGYVQLVDLAPTVLQALNRPRPTKLFTGQPIVGNPGGRPTDPTKAVATLADADKAASAQRGVATAFFLILTLVILGLMAALVPVLRKRSRRRRPATAAERRVHGRWELALAAGALTLPAALIGGGVPWWRWPAPGLMFALLTVLLLIPAVAVTLLLRRPNTIGPLAVAAGIAGLIVAIDVLSGSHLQLNGVAGYSALEGNRYTGIGVVGLGVFLAAVLLVAGCLAQLALPRWRPAVVALVGAFGVVIVGSPYLGGDVGGAIALTAGVCLAAAISTGGWLSFARIAWATLAGLVVTLGFGLIDLSRPEADRGSLGRFLSGVRDGTGGPLLHRTSTANGVAILSSPLTLLSIGSALFLWVVLLRSWGGMKRLFGLYPAVRGAVAGLIVAALLAGLLDGAGFNVAGAAAAVAVPLITLASMRALSHSDDRTALPLPSPFGPRIDKPGKGVMRPAEIANLPEADSLEADLIADPALDFHSDPDPAVEKEPAGP